MNPHVITVDRKKYAIGLLWQPVSVGQNPRDYATKLSKSIDRGMNLYVEYRAMVGLGGRRQGQYGGMPVAAAEIMETFAEYSSFLAIFKENTGYWLVAVRNGIIIADKFFNDVTKARESFDEFMGLPDWGAIFAPSDWAVPRAVEKHLESVISGKSSAALHQISILNANLIFVGIGIAALFLLIMFFREPIGKMFAPRPQIAQIDENLAAEYKKRLEEKNKALDEQFQIVRAEQEALKPPEMPYDNLPEPFERARLCYQAIAYVMQPIPGWVQTNAECGPDFARATLRRGFGNLGDFYAVAPGLMPGAQVTEWSDSEIEVRAALPALERFASLEEADIDTVSRSVSTLFQRLNMEVQINPGVEQVGNVTVNRLEVAAQSKLVPEQFMEIFGEFSGVYMISVRWDARSRVWNYEVVIYVK